MKSHITGRLVLLALTVGAMTSPSVAQPWAFKKIIDSNSPVPGSSSSWASFDPFSSVALSSGRVAFVGFNKLGQNGLYEYADGTVSVIADSNTPIPRGTGNFTNLSSAAPVYSGSNLAFFGAGSQASGLYSRFGSTLGVLLDANTPAPPGYSNFRNSAAKTSLSGTTVAVRASYGSANQSSGIFIGADPTFSPVADTNTNIPSGSGKFTGFNDWHLTGATMTFAGAGPGQAGIYRSSGGSLSMLVNNNTPVPSGFGQFNGFRSLSVDGSDIAFVGLNTDTTHNGLYTRINGQLNLVADLSMDPPGPEDSYVNFAQVAFQNGSVVFWGGSGGVVWTNMGGSIIRVIGDGDTLDGRIVSHTFFDGSGREGNDITVAVAFRGGPSYSAIYVLTIPAPGGVGLLAACGIVAGRRRRRSKASVLRS